MYKQYIESSEISNTLQSSEKSNTLQTLDDLMCVFSQCVKNKVPKNVLMLATCHKIVTLMKGTICWYKQASYKFILQVIIYFSPLYYFSRIYMVS